MKDRFNKPVAIAAIGAIGTVGGAVGGAIGSFQYIFGGQKPTKIYFSLAALILGAILIYIAYRQAKRFEDDKIPPRLHGKENLPEGYTVLTESGRGFQRFDLVGSEKDTIDGICIGGDVYKLLNGGDFVVKENGEITGLSFGTKIVSNMRGFKNPDIDTTVDKKWICN